MYDRRLDAIVAAADAGSFAKAAKRLRISTPAVAKQVNTFEHEYGLTLFDRSRTGVRLTPSGEEFVADARMAMRQCRQIVRRAQRRSASDDAPVRLGVSVLRPGRRVLDLWQRDAGRHADLKLELVSIPDDMETINDIIMHLGDTVDAISTAFDASYWDGVCGTLTIDRETLCVAVPRAHALARRPSLTLDDLEGTRVRLIRRAHGGNDAARGQLERHPAIELVDIDHYDLGTFNECAEAGDLLVSKPMWDGVHPGLVNVPVDWPEPADMSYGLLYPLEPEPRVRGFVERIDELALSTRRG